MVHFYRCTTFKLDLSLKIINAQLHSIHNSRCTIHNYGYFSVITEKFKIDFGVANSVRHDY